MLLSFLHRGTAHVMLTRQSAIELAGELVARGTNRDCMRKTARLQTCQTRQPRSLTNELDVRNESNTAHRLSSELTSSHEKILIP
jgi:hypothetical protein